MASVEDKNKRDGERNKNEHPTSYIETLIHLFKGNIGPGLFAMGDAFRNGGLVLSPFCTVLMAIIAVHCQHILLMCSRKVRAEDQVEQYPDYADTVGLCFERGPPFLRQCGARMRIVVNIFICITQLGFCCIYFVFVSLNINKVLTHNGYGMDVHKLMLIILIPILLTSLITNLKFLAPVSLIANFSMVCALCITLYYALEGGIPSPTERNFYPSGRKLALYFGTTMFAFEGIALVLPLKNSMKFANDFDRKLGVLNIGMALVTLAFIFAGFFGYLKWGEDVGGSLTLNLGTSLLAQCAQVLVSLGVMFGYPIQFFIAIQIMLPYVQTFFKLNSISRFHELTIRTVMVVITLAFAELVPNLGLFISLIGALCSTGLALVFPPMIEIIIKMGESKFVGCLTILKNSFILIVALLGFTTGTYESLSAIAKEFGSK